MQVNDFACASTEEVNDFSCASTDSLIRLLEDDFVAGHLFKYEIIKYIKEKGLTNNQYTLLIDAAQKAIEKEIENNKIMKDIKYWAIEHSKDPQFTDKEDT